MRLSVVATRDRTPNPRRMNWAEDLIFHFQQEGRSLEFLSVHLVSWNNHTVNACLWMGLDNDHLFWYRSPGDCYGAVADFINYVLDLNGSEFFVDVEDSHPVPTRKHVGASAHHKPAPSTYCSNEPAPYIPPMLRWVLPSSSLVLSPKTVAAPLSGLLATPLSSPTIAAASSLTSA